MLIHKIKIYLLKRRYDKLLYEQGKRELEMRDRALAFRLEEAERKTNATLSYYNNNIKKDIESHK